MARMCGARIHSADTKPAVEQRVYALLNTFHKVNFLYSTMYVTRVSNQEQITPNAQVLQRVEYEDI